MQITNYVKPVNLYSFGGIIGVNIELSQKIKL
jgi:hypothetical protein